MTVQERRNYILDTLQSSRTVRATQLALALDVSTETIRRDLEYLEKESQLIRIHGGASILQYDSREYPFAHRLANHADAKEEIARTALQYVSEGQSIALDFSTTCSTFAHELKRSFNNLTIITNSIEVLNIFSDAPTHTVIYLGGIMNAAERGCFGGQAVQALRQLNIDTAFISFGGISFREGFTETFYDGAEVLRELIRSAQQKIALLDSSKFDRVTLISVCPISDVDLVITDSDIKPDVLSKYRTAIDIVCPKKEAAEV